MDEEKVVETRDRPRKTGEELRGTRVELSRGSDSLTRYLVVTDGRSVTLFSYEIRLRVNTILTSVIMSSFYVSVPQFHQVIGECVSSSPSSPTSSFNLSMGPDTVFEI